jgi:hypothetical protein
MSPERTVAERVEINLEEEDALYKWWVQSSRSLWEAIESYKLRATRELKRTQQQLHKACEERDTAVTELVKARRMISKIEEDLRGGRK